MSRDIDIVINKTLIYIHKKGIYRNGNTKLYIYLIILI